MTPRPRVDNPREKLSAWTRGYRQVSFRPEEYDSIRSAAESAGIPMREYLLRLHGYKPQTAQE